MAIFNISSYWVHANRVQVHWILYYMVKPEWSCFVQLQVTQDCLQLGNFRYRYTNFVADKWSNIDKIFLNYHIYLHSIWTTIYLNMGIYTYVYVFLIFLLNQYFYAVLCRVHTPIHTLHLTELMTIFLPNTYFRTTGPLSLYSWELAEENRHKLMAATTSESETDWLSCTAEPDLALYSFINPLVSLSAHI